MEHVDFLQELDAVIADRLSRKPEDSYTARLARDGVARVAQKVGEEAIEVALAGVGPDVQQLAEEAADLLYHLVVLMQIKGLRISDVLDVLEARHRDSG